MAQKFQAEIRTIHVILKGSRWAKDPEIGTVLDEYERVINANAIRSREKRIALQILFSSRAIDSLLAHIVRNDHIRRGEVPERYYVLESSLGHLNGRGLLHGATLGQITYDKLCREVKDKRNKYLHQAGVFPSDAELARFLSATVDGIRRVSQL